MRSYCNEPLLLAADDNRFSLGPRVSLSFLTAVYFPDRITEVKTNIYVTSFGPVSDTDMVSAWERMWSSNYYFFIYFIRCPNAGDSKRDVLGTPVSYALKKKRWCFLCFIFSVCSFPLFHKCIISPGLSTRATAPKRDGVSTRQHNVYSSENFHLINDLIRPLVSLVTSLFMPGSPVYPFQALHLRILSSASLWLLKSRFPSDRTLLVTLGSRCGGSVTWSRSAAHKPPSQR